MKHTFSFTEITKEARSLNINQQLHESDQRELPMLDKGADYDTAISTSTSWITGHKMDVEASDPDLKPCGSPCKPCQPDHSKRSNRHRTA